MRVSFTIILFLITLSSLGQNALKIFIVHYSNHSNTVSYSSFDTVYLISTNVRRHFLPQELYVDDSTFTIENLSSGTYKLTFVSKTLLYDGPSYYVTICSKCENKLYIRADSLKPGAEDISQIPIKPFAIFTSFDRNSGISYSKTLQRDFFKGLNRREIAKIKKNSFMIRAFLVKGIGFCDISIETKSLSRRKKDIILKGFVNLKGKGWELLFRAAEIIITSEELFDD